MDDPITFQVSASGSNAPGSRRERDFAVLTASAYVLFITGNGQRASVAERPVAQQLRKLHRARTNKANAGLKRRCS
jgi:hypothetical protein